MPYKQQKGKTVKATMGVIEMVEMANRFGLQGRRVRSIRIFFDQSRTGIKAECEFDDEPTSQSIIPEAEANDSQERFADQEEEVLTAGGRSTEIPPRFGIAPESIEGV